MKITLLATLKTVVTDSDADVTSNLLGRRKTGFREEDGFWRNLSAVEEGAQSTAADWEMLLSHRVMFNLFFRHQADGGPWVQWTRKWPVFDNREAQSLSGPLHKTVEDWICRASVAKYETKLNFLTNSTQIQVSGSN